jgi:hypothetical protein
MTLSESNQKSYLYTIPLSICYTNLEICCAVILGFFMRQYISHYETIKNQDEQYKDFFHMIVSNLNHMSKLIEIFKLNDVVRTITFLDRQPKHFYMFLLFNIMVIIFCEFQFSRSCAMQSDQLFLEVSEKMSNVSFSYLNRKEFLEFLKENLYTIPYDHGISVINMGKVYYMALICFVLIVTEKIHEKKTCVYFILSVLSGLYINRLQHKSPEYDLDVNDHALFTNNMIYFQNAQDKSYTLYHIILYSVILISGYLLIVTGVQNEYLSIFIVCNIFILIFNLKAVAMNFLLGGYMKNIITNIPVYTASEFKIHKLDSIECTNGNILVAYEGRAVHLIENLSFKMSSGNLYIIQSGSLGRGIIIHYLMRPNENNSQVFVNINDQKYPISRITNLSEYCEVFDSDSAYDSFNLKDDYGLLIDPFDIKLKNLQIITSAVKSDIQFIGLDMTLFTDFNVIEMKNVLNWIEKNRFANKCILITIHENMLQIEKYNSFVYRIDNSVLEQIK